MNGQTQKGISMNIIALLKLIKTIIEIIQLLVEVWHTFS